MTVEELLDFTGIRYLWSKLGAALSSEYASKEELNSIASAVGSGLNFKGSVSAVADLPSAGNQNGDMYSVTAPAPDGGNYAWNGTEWVKLADSMDTSQFALGADVVHLTGAETIGGAKTFSDPIEGDLDGTAEMALKDGAGNVIASTYATTAVATDQVSGLMSAADKAKLDSIQSGANHYSLPQAGYGTLGGVTTTSQVTDTSGLTPCPIVSGVVYYKKGGEGEGGGGEGIVSVGLGLVDDSGTIRLAVKKPTTNNLVLRISEPYSTPYSYFDDEDIYEYNPSPYVIDLSNEAIKLSYANVSFLVSQKTQAQIDALKPDMKSVLTKIHWTSGAITEKTTEIPESAWRSNSCLFYVGAARSENALEYPAAELFDTIERIECVMLKTATAYGDSIGTYFPDMQIVVGGTYWG